MNTRIDACPDEDLFVRLEQGNLHDAERATLMAHIDACPACAELLLMLTSLEQPQNEFHSEEILPKANKKLAIGRYEIIEQAGVGGVGVVYKTRDTRLDRLVAVKLIRPDLLATHPEQVTEATQRLQREARTLARLDHPHIVTIYDVDTHEDRLFTACAFIEGGNLRDWLAHAEDHWTQRVQLCLQVARALAAAHAVGVIHRDVKPENVLVHADRDFAMLTDFGMATPPMNTTSVHLAPQELATQQGTILGTPAYMSPEQLDGQSATAASDQFSFCVMLYEAVYGFRPYHATDYQHLLDTLKRGQLTRPESATVPDVLFEILHKGLRPRPAERHADMHALVRCLEEILAPPTPAPISRWRAVTLFGALAIFGALAALYITSRPSETRRSEPTKTVQSPMVRAEPDSPTPVDAPPTNTAKPTPAEEPLLVEQPKPEPIEQTPVEVASLTTKPITPNPTPPRKKSAPSKKTSAPPAQTPPTMPPPSVMGKTIPPDLARTVVDTYEDRRAFQMAVYAYDGKKCKQHFDRVVAALPGWEFAKEDNLDNLRCQYLQGDCAIAKKFAPLLSSGLVPMDEAQIKRHNLMYAPASCLKSTEDKILASAHHIIMDCPTHQAPSKKCLRRAKTFRTLITQNPDTPLLDEREVKSALYFIKDVPE